MKQNTTKHVAPPPFSGGGWEGAVEVSAESQNETLPFLQIGTAKVSHYANTLPHLLGFITRTLPPPSLPLKKGEELPHYGLFYRALLLSYFLFHLSYLASAQTAYTGGPGDGHAMGELQLRQVTVNELSISEGYYIYPSLAQTGENIYITSPVAGEFTLVDVTGRIIYKETFETPVQRLPIPVTSLGLCIGILRTAGGTFTQKIIVVE
ncbi:hypothetical protein BH09BAC1_BH09BAC1_15130 [soil metagenome]